MLKIDELYYWHNVEHSLLNGIDLTLQKGELLTILGANGRGKSTLLNCIRGGRGCVPWSPFRVLP